MGASEARVLRTLRAVLLALHVATVHTVREGHIPAAAHLQQHPEEPKNTDRLQCLREDNLDLVGKLDADERYILREVIPTSDDTSGDLYVFCEQIQVHSLNARVHLKRVGEDEFEFKLTGNKRRQGRPEQVASGEASFMIRGFEILTTSKLISWAAYLTANADQLRKGQSGKIFFNLSGRLRARKVKGHWETELVSTRVGFWKLQLPRQKVIDFALNNWNLEKRILDELYGVIKEALPVNFLAVLTYLPLQGYNNPRGAMPGEFRDQRRGPQEQEDLDIKVTLHVDAKMKEPNGKLSVKTLFQFKMQVDPVPLLDVLVQHFDVKEMAMEAVRKLLNSQDVIESWALGSPEQFLETLRQYRFVLSDAVRQLVTKEGASIEDLIPFLLEAAEQRANDILVSGLAPLVKAHKAGEHGLLNNFSANLLSTASWRGATRLLEASLEPGEATLFRVPKHDHLVLEMNRSLLENLGLRGRLPVPVKDTASELTIEGVTFDSRTLRVRRGHVTNWRHPENENGDRSWEVESLELANMLLQLPQAAVRRFNATLDRIRVIFQDELVQVKGLDDGLQVKKLKPRQPPLTALARLRSGAPERADGQVPVRWQRTIEHVEMELLDFVDSVSTTLFLTIKGTGQGGLELSVEGPLHFEVEMKPFLQEHLASRPRQDFGYIFFHTVLHLHGTSDSQVHLHPGLVIVVLNCGFLRVIQWPLPLDKLERLNPSYQILLDLSGLRKPNPLETKDEMQCLRLTFASSKSWGYFENWYLLCGGEPEATDLYDALLAQHRRFRDVRAPGWAYGSHEASEEPFVLRPGVRQMNLQQALTISFSLAETNATTHVERAEHARSTRRVAGTAGDASGARVEAHSQEEATEAARASSLRAAPSEPEPPHGSKELLKCRAEEAMHLHWPPEHHHAAVLKLAVPTKALGDVFVQVKRMQLLTADLHLLLLRESDTSFSLEVGGPKENGAGGLRIYLQDVDFAASDYPTSSMLLRALGAVHILPFWNIYDTDGELRSSLLHSGVVNARIKLKMHFHLVDGHWQMNVGALSDVKVVFEEGGAVQQLLNVLIGTFDDGDLGDWMMHELWDYLVKYFPETVGQVLTEVSQHDGPLKQKFTLWGRCAEFDGLSKCKRDEVQMEIWAITQVDVAADALFPQYQSKCKAGCQDTVALSLLKSYVDCTAQQGADGADAEGGALLDGSLLEAKLDVNVHEGRAEVTADGRAAAPQRMLRCFLGKAVSDALAPPNQTSTVAGSFGMTEPGVFKIQEVDLERLRLPLSSVFGEEAFEFSTHVKNAVLRLNSTTGVVDAMDGSIEVDLDQAQGLTLKPSTEPKVSMTISRSYLQSLFKAWGEAYPRPRNVRSGPEHMPDGVVPWRFRRPRVEPIRRLDVATLLQKAELKSSFKVFSRGQERLGGRVALTFAATMEFPQDVWRALLNRRTYDLGFLSLSMLGQWAGAKHEPLQPALLEISCGRVRVYAVRGTKGPYKTVLFSRDLFDIFQASADQLPVFPDIGEMICWEASGSHSVRKHGRSAFCPKSTFDLKRLQEVLYLSISRFSHLPEAVELAEGADAKAEAISGLKAEGIKLYRDSTWFRRYDPLDDSSHFPELPASQRHVQTPLQRWRELTAGA